MLKRLLKKDEGFTLIEVIIVLAIAALIILVVLQAVAAAQRAQRDNTRKQEGGRIVSFITEYESNNNGASPTAVNNGACPAAPAAGTFYLQCYDPTLGTKYTGTFGAVACPAQNATTWNYYVQANGTRDFHLQVCLEAGQYDQLK